MSKKSAIGKLTLIIVFALIGSFFAIACFNIPFTNTKWNSFIGGLNTGNDISNGIVASYDFELINTSEDINKKAQGATNKIYETLNKYYSEPAVFVDGKNQIKVEIGSDGDFSSDERIENVLASIGGDYSFKVANDDDSKVITIGQVKSIYYKNFAGTDTLIIEFNKSGKKMLEEISNECRLLGTNMTITFTSAEQDSISSVPSETITDGKLYISGGLNKAGAVARIIGLECEQSGVILTYDSTKQITASNGVSFTVAFGIALVAILAIMLVLLCVRYRAFGAISVFVSLIFMAIYSLLLNILPGMQITTGSLIGIAMAFVLSILSIALICEKTREENFMGKKVRTAFEFGYKKAMKTIFDVSFALIIPTFALIFIGSSSVNNFAYAFVVGLFVNLLTTLVIAKSGFKSAIKLWSKNPKAFNLNKGGEKESNV